MDIATAKQQIKNTVQIYLQKDILGNYRIPVVHQRPVFLQGPPGLGKTAIMKQISDEMGIGLVSYSMTHHTRQSALGLPVIVEKEYGGTSYQVSEYTMSEIIASIYDCMRTTGKKEGILFLDEINCVSETLSPSMLLFLQYKVFGGHQIPEGWVVITAGNPPRYNKSAREFDAATRDRMKFMVLEPDYPAWKKYAVENGIARCIISYLDIRGGDFYKAVTTVNGMNVVTPRTWEDLSEIIAYHEELDLPVEEALICQYLQDPETARDFAIYYQLYQRYKNAYQIEEILNGEWNEDTLIRAREEKTDQRITLVGLLLESLYSAMGECTERHDGLSVAAEKLKAAKDVLAADHSAAAALVNLAEEWKKEAAAADGMRKRALLKLLTMEQGWAASAMADESVQTENSLNIIKGYYKEEVAILKTEVAKTQEKTGNLLKFLKEAYGQGMEVGLAVNDLSTVPEASYFIGRFLSKEYFEENSGLLLHKQEDALYTEINIRI